jgi:hypothetical protein
VNPPRKSLIAERFAGSNLPFAMQVQQEPDWCWAAVAVSINDFLFPKPQPTWEQKTLATPVLRLERQISNTIDCSATPDQCNYGAALDDALAKTGDLLAGGTLLNQHLVFSSITAWIDQDTPIAARIVWFIAGAHFIALDGYRVLDSGEQMVHVQDPLYGPSFQAYDDLVNDYPPGGVWQDTYLIQS